MYYKGIQDVLTSQYQKGILTVDFQAMLDLQPCSSCHGSKLRPEAMSVYLLAQHTVAEKPTKKKAPVAGSGMIYAQDITEKYSIYDLQTLPLRELIIVLDRYRDVAT